MAEKKTSPTLTALINEYSVMSVNLVQLRSDISMHFSSGRGRESFKRYWDATSRLQSKLMNDYSRATRASRTSRKRSYLLTQNEDGSLDLMDVLSVSQVTPSGQDAILQCRVTSKTVKL